MKIIVEGPENDVKNIAAIIRGFKVTITDENGDSFYKKPPVPSAPVAPPLAESTDNSEDADESGDQSPEGEENNGSEDSAGISKPKGNKSKSKKK